MSEAPKPAATITCSCGTVEILASGTPIMVVACHCDDCREGARQIEALANAPPVREPGGGVAYVLYRKDRVEFMGGDRLLRRYRLKEGSGTSRAVATCCNSAMFLDFERGHWLSIYRARLRGDVPKLQMRIQTKLNPAGGEVPGDVPGYASFPLKFAGKLLAARIAMLLGR